jgi:single-strand DNA-binding protein
MFKLDIAGVIGQDAVLRNVTSANGGTAVANFSVAVKSRRKGQDGKPLTNWVECSMWGKRAEALAQYLQKGSLVAVTGEPGVSSYEGQNGLVLKQTLTVNDISLLGGNKTQESQAQPMGQVPSNIGFDQNLENVPF